MTAHQAQTKDIACDVVVIGGGIAGTVAAIAAARLGADTVLIQDRPVLGGNSSSEIRVSPVGADFNNRHARESGILEELRIELALRDRWQAPYGTGRPAPLWDGILWEWASREPHLQLYLNTRAREVVVDDSRITAVVADQISTEQSFRFSAPIFVDCSGDGAIAAQAGAEFMIGREARDDFGESRGRDTRDRRTLCSTLTFGARDTGQPVPFTPPSWAHHFHSCDDLKRRFHARKDYGYWWIEYGGELDTIQDNEKIRDELLRILYGVWDHIKNHCDGSAANYALDFVGAVVGKRESRRFVGAHVLTQNDLEKQVLFDDRVAFGGWPLDADHPPKGIFSDDPPGEMVQRHYMMEKTGREYPKGVLVKHLYTDPPSGWTDFLPPLPGLYSVPLRSLYSANIANLFLAGRHVSASHIAFGSLRVQGTTGTMGQAAGTAAAVASLKGLLPHQLAGADVSEIQQLLLREDAYIIALRNQDPADLARTARVAAASEAVMDCGEPGQDGDDPREGAARGYTIEEGQFSSAAADSRWPLDVPRGQMFQVTADRIDAVQLLLRGTADAPGRITATLHRATTLGRFKEDAIESIEVAVPAGTTWVTLPFNRKVEPGLYWIALPATPGISWIKAPRSPIGTYRAAWYEEYNSWDRLFDCLAFRLDPPSRPYGPANVVNGFARPEAAANIWISDPAQPLPQWLELSWDKPQRIGSVLLTFDTHLDAMLTLGRIGSGPVPECVRDYTLLAEVDGRLQEIVSVTGNYHRHRRHDFPEVSARRLRLVVTATNGHPTARVYELRAYATLPVVKRQKEIAAVAG
ncbi:MAG: FAD-dependent oxidoreductase [Bauldia sp.]